MLFNGFLRQVPHQIDAGGNRITSGVCPVPFEPVKVWTFVAVDKCPHRLALQVIEL